MVKQWPPHFRGRSAPAKTALAGKDIIFYRKKVYFLQVHVYLAVSFAEYGNQGLCVSHALEF